MMIYEPDGAVLTQFLWDRSRLAVIQGPIQSGTSTCSCHKIWTFAMEQEPDFDGVRRSRWIVTRDTYKDLRETTIPTWLTWFPESAWGPMVHSEPAYHQMRAPTVTGWKLPEHPSGDGSVIDCEVIFLAIPDPDVAEKILASFEITGFFRNEGQFCEKRVIDELLSRCARYPSKRNGPGAEADINDSRLHETIDGHQWVIYTSYNLDVLRHSDNEDAYIDNFGGEDAAHLLKDRGISGLHAVMAYCAMEQDVQSILSDALDEAIEEHEKTVKA